MCTLKDMLEVGVHINQGDVWNSNGGEGGEKGSLLTKFIEGLL